MFKRNGGVFGRNPTFNNVEIEGTLGLKALDVLYRTGTTRVDDVYEFKVPAQGALTLFAAHSNNSNIAVYGRAEIIQIYHENTSVGTTDVSAIGGNGDITVTKPDNTTLRVTFDKNAASGSGNYPEIGYLVLFGGI